MENKIKIEMKLKDIIKILEQTRKDKNLSYEEVAKLINSSRSNVWKCLTGLSIPNSETLLLLIDCLGFDFKIRKKSTIENFIENVNRISEENLKPVDSIIPEEKIKGKWIEESGKVDKEKINEIKKRNTKAKSTINTKKVLSEPKKEILECKNCTYETLKSGIKILLKKCNDCKTKKK